MKLQELVFGETQYIAIAWFSNEELFFVGIFNIQVYNILYLVFAIRTDARKLATFPLCCFSLELSSVSNNR